MNKRQLRNEYKMSHRPMGVFQIRSTVNERIFVDSSTNVPGKINRHRFALAAGLHKSKSLQEDWNSFGEGSFEFEVLETVEPRDDPNYGYLSDLGVLEDLWLEKLEPYGDRGYNEKKKSADERLRMIRDRRASTA